MPEPVVSIVIPADAGADVSACAAAMLDQHYDAKEVIVVTPRESGAKPNLPGGVRLVKAEGSGARLINSGLRSAKGAVRIVVMPHARPAHPAWLRTMAAPFENRDVGAVVSQCVASDALPAGPLAATLRAVLPCELQADDEEPAEVDSVSLCCAAYRASVLEEIGGLDDEGVPSPGDAIDASVKIIATDHTIVAAPGSRLIAGAPPEARSLRAALGLAWRCGVADAVLGRRHGVDWLSTGVWAAALCSLALVPLAFVHLPAAWLASAALFVWGWFLPLRLPIIRWEWPVALLNLAVYAAIVKAISPDWLPDVFPPREYHPSMVRQWCVPVAMAASYVLLFLGVGLRTSGSVLRRERRIGAALAAFPRGIAWWAAAGMGHIHGYILGGRAKKD